VELEIEPRVWECKKILKVIEAAGKPMPERLDPTVDFPLIIAYCETCDLGKGT
jgi:hypothetical protein